jgi:hypothetical protein
MAIKPSIYDPQADTQFRPNGVSGFRSQHFSMEEQVSPLPMV